MDYKTVLKVVGRLATERKISVFLVGGAVRDDLLGLSLENLPDFDVMASSDSLGLAEDVARFFGEEAVRLVPFPDFGTARLVFLDGGSFRELEIAAARKESYRESSRKPDVSPASLEEDLSRRDFTINAMAREIRSDGSLGRLIDPFGGEKDLRAGFLRTPLDPVTTFHDDPLRMLRAARFAARFHFALDPAAIKAMADERERLKIVSAERIKDEFLKLLSAPIPSEGLSLLYGTGLVDIFLPEVAELSGVEEAYGYSHKDNLSHTFAVVDNIATESNSPLLRYAGLMHDIAKPATKKFTPGRGWTFDMHEHLGRKMAKDISLRLKFSLDETRHVAELVRWHLQPIALMDEGITDSALRRLILNLKDRLPDLLVLCKSDITTGNQKKKERRLRNYAILEERLQEVMEKDRMRAWRPALMGEEIMKISGLKPGPTIGRLKKEIERAILDGEIKNDHDEALNYLESIKEGFVLKAEDWEKDPPHQP